VPFVCTSNTGCLPLISLKHLSWRSPPQLCSSVINKTTRWLSGLCRLKISIISTSVVVSWPDDLGRSEVKDTRRGEVGRFGCVANLSRVTEAIVSFSIYRSAKRRISVWTRLTAETIYILLEAMLIGFVNLSTIHAASDNCSRPISFCCVTKTEISGHKPFKIALQNSALSTSVVRVKLCITAQ